MRVVIDEDIPAGLTLRFRARGHSVSHVDEIGLKGTQNGALLAAISGSVDILVTGDTSLGHQQNLKEFDLAIIVIRPSRLVIDQIIPLIPQVIAAYETAPKHEVTTIGRPTTPGTRR
jgi:predicted nuclease of predicted toxin-antitoxin system